MERFFHGFDAKYNDIPDWNYGALFKAFSSGVRDVQTFKVAKATVLDALFSSDELQNATGPQVRQPCCWLYPESQGYY